MANAQQSGFPTLGTCMDLARAYVNDMYPGIAGTSGRVLTNNAPFTIPYINSALRTVNRKLRNEGVTYPIKDNVILANLTPVIQADPSIQVFVGFDGYFDGTSNHASPKLPSDCLQVFDVQEQTDGTDLPFSPMAQPQGGIISTFQGPWLSIWEWRQYRIYMPGSTSVKNLRIRYLSGQPPFNSAPDDFDTTPVNILDCEEAMAYQIAIQYARARGAADVSILMQGFTEAIDDMANEWVRRQQNQNFRRPAYGGSGSSDVGTPLGPIGQTQGV